MSTLRNDLKSFYHLFKMIYTLVYMWLAFLENLKTMVFNNFNGWQGMGSKCYWIKKQIEPFYIHTSLT